MSLLLLRRFGKRRSIPNDLQSKTTILPRQQVLAVVVFLLLLGSCHSFSPYNKRTRLLSSKQLGMSSSTTVVSETTQDALQGKTVLVTGASGGLGAKLALQIANHCRPKALVLSARNQESLESVAKECSDATTTVHIVTADLSDKESVQSLAEQALELVDGVDVLVNCGGVSSRSDFVDTNLEVDERVMQINFFAGAALAKAVVPGMISRGHGQILWISSVQGLMGIPSRTSYAASKFAVQGYCEALRAELHHAGISVHCASPGYIRTNLSRSAVTGNGTAHGQLDATTANGADPNDVAVEILDRSCKGEADFVVAANLSARIAIWLRLLLPSLLQKLLVKRYAKAQAAATTTTTTTTTAATDKKLD